jgi:hypothetical protein
MPAKSWLLPPVYERLIAGQGDFLAEFRPATAFLYNRGSTMRVIQKQAKN